MFKPPTSAAMDSSTTENTTTEKPLAPNPLTSNSIVGGNGLSVNDNGFTVAANLSTGNGLQSGLPTSTNIFVSTVQEENAWSPPNNTVTNLFIPNATTDSAPKPLSFGVSMASPFNGTPAPAFGMNKKQTSTPVFGSNLTTSPPAFGSAEQLAATPAFGATEVFNITMPSIFDPPNQNSQPSLLQNSMAMFGSPQQQVPSFGFGQQLQQQPAVGIGGQTSASNVGAAGGQTEQVQFSMGSALNASGRRIRRAVQRSSQR